MTSSEPETVNVYKEYLSDLGYYLDEYAQQARANRDKYQGSDKEDTYSGYLLGFHRIISLMQDQAKLFGIPLEEIHLDGINPDRDLL